MFKRLLNGFPLDWELIHLAVVLFVLNFFLFCF